MYALYSKMGMLRTLTSGVQTPHPISTIFNRLPQGAIASTVTENEDPALKTVGPSVFTDRQTHRHTDTQTDTQTDRHDQFHDSCPSPDGQL